MPNTIKESNISDSAVTTAKIADNAITSDKIAPGAVVAADVADGGVSTAKLASDAVTGAKIADDAVDSEHLVDGSVDAVHISGLTNSSSGFVQSDGDGTFSVTSITQASGTEISNVVEDTTPQLGGNLQSNGNRIDFADNDKLQFGTGEDLQIYHDGSNSYIKDQGTGDLRIMGANVQIQDGAGDTQITILNNGKVGLSYNANEKLATTDSGVAVTGRATGTQTTDNDGSFDLSASNHFVCTPTANFTLTFTNHTAGQAGTIILINSSGYTVSAASTTKVMGADLLTTITTAGTYVLGYISDGTNTRIYNSGAQQ